MLNIAGMDLNFMEQVSRIGPTERQALKQLALDGAAEGTIKVSCAAFATQIDASTQTASRRLQQLEDAEMITREHVPDGQWIDITETGTQALRADYEAYRRIFEDVPAVRLTGTVTDGMGEGRHYISLEGYRDQFVERLGYEPYPGTLNVRLDEASQRRRTRLESLEEIPIDAWEDADRTYGPAACYPAMAANDHGERVRSVHVIVPERTHHDPDNLELVAPDRLRDTLGLVDDTRIDISVTGRDQR